MKWTSIICAAAITSPVMFSNVCAEGKEIDGNELKALCENPEESGLCVGHVNGVADSMIYENIFCIPSRTTHERFTRIVKDYLAEHPDKLHIHAGILILEALKEAYPCPDTPTD
jgi:hypothetical protein